MKKESQKKTQDVAITRQGMVGWFLVFLLVSAIMFSLGVIVGRGTSPVTFNLSELEKDLTELRMVFSMKNDDPDAIRLSEKPKIEFYDKLRKKDEDDTIDIKKITPSNLPKPKEEYKGEKTPEDVSLHQKTSSVTARVEKESEKPATAPKKETVVSQPETESQGRYTVQVAALKSMEDAEKLVKELKGKGYNAYRSIGKDEESGLWYRVRIGDYNEKESAQKLLEKLKKDNIKGFLLNR